MQCSVFVFCSLGILAFVHKRRNIFTAFSCPNNYLVNFQIVFIFAIGYEMDCKFYGALWASGCIYYSSVLRVFLCLVE